MFEKTFHLFVCPALKLNDCGLEPAAPRRSLIETCPRCDNQTRTGLALDLREHRDPFRCNFRVRQNIFDGGELGFRQEERGGIPVEQALVEQFLGMNTATEDPNGLVDLARDCGDEKCLRRLDDVRELHWPLRFLDCAKFAHNWLAISDDFQKLCASRFLHR